jgi:hypothetical protein
MKMDLLNFFEDDAREMKLLFYFFRFFIVPMVIKGIFVLS